MKTLLNKDVVKNIETINNLVQEKDKLSIELQSIIWKNFDFTDMKMPSYEMVRSVCECDKFTYDDIVERIHSQFEDPNSELGLYCLIQIVQDSDALLKLIEDVSKSIAAFSSQDGEDFLILETAKSYFGKGIFSKNDEYIHKTPTDK